MYIELQYHQHSGPCAGKGKEAEPVAGKYSKGRPRAGVGSSCRAAAPSRAGGVHEWGGLSGSLLPSRAFGRL